MRRDADKAEDFARRHGVPRAYGTVAGLLADPDVDAVYVATTPSSHHAIALEVAASGKPCLMEKPMAMSHTQCLDMIDAFDTASTPLWVAYYRRALPRFRLVRRLMADNAIGRLTSVHIEIAEPLATEARAATWRFNPLIAGAGLFFDLASHCVDLVDFLAGPIADASGYSSNTGGRYAAGDVTSAAFACGDGVTGTGSWNFNAPALLDRMRLVGSTGTIVTPVLGDGDVLVTAGGETITHAVRNPPHVHQPLIQTVVDELCGLGTSPSPASSGARASWVLDRILGRA
jgi:predicted dehydrogenase